MKLYDFYFPAHKYELVIYLGERYPQDLAKFKKLKIRILRAIYLNLRNRQDELYPKKSIGKKELPKM